MLNWLRHLFLRHNRENCWCYEDALTWTRSTTDRSRSPTNDERPHDGR